MKKVMWTTLTVVVLLGLLLVACRQAPQPTVAAPIPTPAPKSLKIAFIPGGDVDTEMKLFSGIVDNVAEQVNRQIEVEAATSYASVVEALRQNHIQLARLGPFTYVQAREQGIPVSPIVVEDLVNKGTSYKCILIARTDRGVKFDWTPEAVSKLILGLVEEGSTSGSIIPQAESLQYDPPITLESWQEVVWTGSHNASIAAVQEGHVDLAFIADRRLDAALREGVVGKEEIEVLWESGPIPNSPFVARIDLGIETLVALEFAFRHVPDELLTASALNGFATANDGLYRYIYRVGEEYRKLKE